MKRAVLPLLTVGLFALVLADRLGREWATPDAEPSLGDTRPGNVELEPAAPAADPVPTPMGTSHSSKSGTPTIDRMARLAVRQHLSRMAALTYLDSLIASTDSMVRRWPDPQGVPLRVAIIEGGPPGYRSRMAGYVKEAFGLWEGSGIGVRFTMVPDTSGFDILVRWIDHFDFDRAGQTDLTWDQGGRVRKAVILLALRTNTGVVLPNSALLTVAVHEVGHALGLPHSPDSGDVMFPATQRGTLSDRDRRTAQVLYQLPTGPVRDLSITP
jgi:hypothetical protein